MAKNKILGIFKKRSIKDEIKKLRDKSKPVRLETITNYFTIAGTVVSLFFAGLSIRLTMKYGESQDQIKALRKIAEHQQDQNHTLFNILVRLEAQDNSIKEEIAQLKKIATETVEQNALIKEDVEESQQISRNINFQLKISRESAYRQKKDDIIRQKNNKNSLFVIHSEIRDSLVIYREQAFPDKEKASDAGYRNAWIERAKNLIRRVLFLLKSELDNEVLITNGGLNKIWYRCIDDINQANKLFFYSDPATYEGIYQVHRKLANAQQNFEEFSEEFNSFFK